MEMKNKLVNKERKKDDLNNVVGIFELDYKEEIQNKKFNSVSYTRCVL